MKSKKDRLKSDIERYRSIVANCDHAIHREDVYQKMSRSITAWIIENSDYAARSWFEKVEQSIFRNENDIRQEEFGFCLNPEAIVPLGDSQRIRVGFCDLPLARQRLEILIQNRDKQIEAAEKQINAWQEAMSKLQEGQTIDDLFPCA